MPHDSLLYLLGAGILYTGGFLAALHILLNTREEANRAALWLLAVFAFPGVGLLLYLCCGLNRRDTLGHRVTAALDRIANSSNKELLDLFGKRNESLSRFLAKEKESGESTSSFRAMLDRLFPNRPPLSGNAAELLCDGVAAYPEMFRAIHAAKESIHMQSFIIANDRIGNALFRLLEKKAQEGVRVKVIYDSFGSFGAMTTHFFRRYAHYSENMLIRAFSRATLIAPWRNQLRNHRKLLIVDGKTAFLGGLNISAENFQLSAKRGPAIHDLHCRLRGPAVSELQYVFLEDWCIAAKQAPANVFKKEYFPVPEPCGENTARVIASGHGYEFQGSEHCFFTAAATAKQYIWICTPYFVPDSPFIMALRMAALRGVDVRILLPMHNNHFFMRLASANLYLPLCQDGVRIFERKGIFTHAKAMLSDGEWALFGSSNCDIRSFRLNYELDLAVTSGPFLNALHAQLLHEMDNAREIRLEEAARTSLPVRLAQSFCALFTPIL